MESRYEREALGHLATLPVNRQNVRLLFQCSEVLVPFIGAGLVADFGFPAWHELLKTLATTAGLNHEAQLLLAEGQYEEAAELVYDVVPNQFNDTLLNTFNSDSINHLLHDSAIRHIPYISRGIVLTTNFDAVLEAAFECAGSPFQRVFPGARIKAATRAVQLNERCLLKLHGDYRDQENRILTLTEYKRHYGGVEPKETDLTLPIPTVLGQALAARPLLFLGCSLKTDRTIRVISHLAKRLEGTMHFALLSAEEANSERLHQLDGWNIRPLFFPAQDYKQIDGFLHSLARHCSDSEVISGKRKSIGQLKPPQGQQLVTVDDSRPSERIAVMHGPLPQPTVRINGFKIFYFRRNRKLGVKALAKLAGLPHRELSRLEQVKIRTAPFGSHCFAFCTPKTLENLERVLGCPGKLLAGQPDDFLTLYMLFYRQYRGTNTARDPNDSQLTFPFETKAVVFDFDGTLTAHNDDETTWEKIWVKLGYSINDCSDLHWKYSNGKFTHQRWCDITRDHFRNARFSRKDLDDVVASIKLIGGARAVIDSLRERGIKLYILSGSIRQVIDKVLGDLRSRFDDVQANDMIFDPSGIIREIRGTPYDFEGKATYLAKVIEENGYTPYDVLFIGNSCNDIFASRSGARTLCVNPRGTESNNREHWTYLLRRMEDLNQIIEFVNL